MISILYQNVGWVVLDKKAYSKVIDELRKEAAELIEKEQVAHVIYATKEYEDNGDIYVKPYLLKCTEEEFQDYCSRESTNHIIKAVHNHNL